MSENELGKALIALIMKNAVVERETLTRAESMANMYGEACTKAKAAELISCSVRSVTNLVNAGKIRACCDGTKIDVRSIAEYIEAKPTKSMRGRKEAWMV